MIPGDTVNAQKGALGPQAMAVVTGARSVALRGGSGVPRRFGPPIHRTTVTSHPYFPHKRQKPETAAHH